LNSFSGAGSPAASLPRTSPIRRRFDDKIERFITPASRDSFVRYDSAKLLLTIDLIGTFVFAVEGATAAIQGDLDLLGLMVLSFATALAGGIIRDLLIGAIPPGAIRDWRYAAVAFLAGAVVFFWHRYVSQVPETFIMVVDAAGLGLFAVAGAAKALDYGIHPFMAVLMGGITGVGGGTVRDILLARVPTVLRSDIYAVAALAGAAVMVVGLSSGLPPTLTTITGALVCFALRVIAVWRHWNLPRVIPH
jgi:uncharacterized membrane protein YeiH